jgi:superfamily II DNA/RNA helicase
LVEQLAAVGVRAGALHGGKTQYVRTRTLAEFREGRVGVLVATNVAARGIHVDDVSMVVHVDPPGDAKDYLHRAGRTARAGESGLVVTLVLPRQRRSTFTMLQRAGVEPVRTSVTATGPELGQVTGARQPSGVPVPAHVVAPPRGPSADHRRPRPATRGADSRGHRAGGRRFSEQRSRPPVRATRP